MWSLLLSIRYFLSRRKTGIIPFINFTSILGVMLGVAALIIVMSIMNGFDTEMHEKIVGTYADLMVLKEGGIEQPRDVARKIRSISLVEGTAGFVSGQAVLRKGGAITGILIKGVNLQEERRVTNIASFLDTVPEGFHEGSIVLGSELVANLGITRGDTVELLVPHSGRAIDKVRFRVAGTFNSGRYDYDANMGILPLSDAQALYRTGESVTGIGVCLAKGTDVAGMKRRLQMLLGPSYVVKTWMDLDRTLVTAVALEKKMMFIILALIIVVACFNISSSLVMAVMEKTRDIGILKAIGASSGGISSVFFLQALLIGAMGVTAGTAAGMYMADNVNAIMEVIERFTGWELFPADVYYFSSIPVEMPLAEIYTIAGCALLLALLAGVYPAWKASRLDPVEAIRYE